MWMIIFFTSWLFYRFSGSNVIQVVLRSSLHFGTPETCTAIIFFIFSISSCRRIIERRTPQNLVAKLDQLVLELSCSRQRRPQNAILILESSRLRFHRGTARFIAPTRNPSRRLKEFEPEILHRCSMGHYSKSYRVFFHFILVFDLEGPELRALVPKKLGPPKNGDKVNEKKKSPYDFA